MGLRLNLLAATAILLPAAAGAQAAQQDQQPAAGAAAQQPAAGAAASQADTKGQAGASAQADTKAQADAKGAAKSAAKADVKAGAAVFDSDGNSVGKIESVDGKGAVLNTGKIKVQVPVSSFAQGSKGLTIAMSKADIEAAAKKSSKE